MTKKLAGAAADTAAWVTSVGNEHGQVLISVLTEKEGEVRPLPRSCTWTGTAATPRDSARWQ